MPSEVILEILRHVVLIDPASYGRLALVCKQFAYQFANEQHIWRRLCQGAEYGFGAMHYSFACDVKGNPYNSFVPRYTPFPFDCVNLQIPKPLGTWSQVFQCFPRIRFTGVYISTVNYTRPGANSSLQNVSWNSPIHIVTYYRYLRFYPDGSVISLLTTTEPVDVVPHISKENIESLSVAVPAHRRRHHHTPSDSASTAAHPVANPIPSTAAATLKSALRGRWYLKNPSLVSQTSDQQPGNGSQPTSNAAPPASKHRPADNTTEDPRDVFIETEGVDPKYTYAMYLSLRSTSSGHTSRTTSAKSSPSNTSKNTKLMWKGFWSYNRLTDDWAEFGLRNDRAFVFRRVRGWGMV